LGREEEGTNREGWFGSSLGAAASSTSKWIALLSFAEAIMAAKEKSPSEYVRPGLMLFRPADDAIDLIERTSSPPCASVDM